MKNNLTFRVISFILCAAIALSMLAGFSVSASQPEESSLLEIRSAQLILDENINIRYKTIVPANAENVTMTFLFNGRTTVLTEHTTTDCEDGTKQCWFVFENLLPYNLGDNISAVLSADIDGVAHTKSLENYSVLQYCLNLLENKTNDSNSSLRTLLVDLIKYGAESQRYCTYNRNDLVSNYLPDDIYMLGTTDATDLAVSVKSLEGTPCDDYIWNSVTLILQNSVEVRFRFTAADIANLTIGVKIGGGSEKLYASDSFIPVPESENEYYLYFDNVTATQFDEMITAEFYEGGSKIGKTLTYSVASYVASMKDSPDTELGDLVRAIYNYGTSAKNYKNFATLENKVTVSFAAGDDNVTGEPPSAIEAIPGTKITLPEAGEMLYGGYLLDGWSLGEDKYIEGTAYTVPENSVTLTAAWVLESEAYATIEFNTNGGETIAPLRVRAGRPIQYLPTPETMPAETLDFAGWYRDENLESFYSLGISPTANETIVLYADYTEEQEGLSTPAEEITVISSADFSYTADKGTSEALSGNLNDYFELSASRIDGEEYDASPALTVLSDSGDTAEIGISGSQQDFLYIISLTEKAISEGVRFTGAVYTDGSDDEEIDWSSVKKLTVRTRENNELSDDPLKVREDPEAEVITIAREDYISYVAQANTLTHLKSKLLNVRIGSILKIMLSLTDDSCAYRAVESISYPDSEHRCLYLRDISEEEFQKSFSPFTSYTEWNGAEEMPREIADIDTEALKKEISESEGLQNYNKLFLAAVKDYATEKNTPLKAAVPNIDPTKIDNVDVTDFTVDVDWNGENNKVTTEFGYKATVEISSKAKAELTVNIKQRLGYGTYFWHGTRDFGTSDFCIWADYYTNFNYHTEIDVDVVMILDGVRNDIQNEITNLTENPDSASYVDTYRKLLALDTDEIELFRVPICEPKLVVQIITLSFPIDFVVSLDVNSAFDSHIVFSTSRNFGFKGDSNNGIHKVNDEVSTNYSYEFYYNGKIGLKAGIAIAAQVQFTGLSWLGSVQLAVEVGVYIDFFGIGFSRAQTQINNGEKVIAKSGQGVSYLVIGVYLDVSISATFFEVFSVGTDLVNVKFPILTLGEKWAAKEFIFTAGGGDDQDYKLEKAKDGVWELTVRKSNFSLWDCGIDMILFDSEQPTIKKNGKDVANEVSIKDIDGFDYRYLLYTSSQGCISGNCNNLSVNSYILDRGITLDTVFTMYYRGTNLALKGGRLETIFRLRYVPENIDPALTGKKCTVKYMVEDKDDNGNYMSKEIYRLTGIKYASTVNFLTFGYSTDTDGQKYLKYFDEKGVYHNDEPFSLIRKDVRRFDYQTQVVLEVKKDSNGDYVYENGEPVIELWPVFVYPYAKMTFNYQRLTKQSIINCTTTESCGATLTFNEEDFFVQPFGDDFYLTFKGWRNDKTGELITDRAPDYIAGEHISYTAVYDTLQFSVNCVYAPLYNRGYLLEEGRTDTVTCTYGERPKFNTVAYNATVYPYFSFDPNAPDDEWKSTPPIVTTQRTLYAKYIINPSDSRTVTFRYTDQNGTEQNVVYTYPFGSDACDVFERFNEEHPNFTLTKEPITTKNGFIANYIFAGWDYNLTTHSDYFEQLIYNIVVDAVFSIEVDMYVETYFDPGEGEFAPAYSYQAENGFVMMRNQANVAYVVEPFRKPDEEHIYTFKGWALDTGEAGFDGETELYTGLPDDDHCRFVALYESAERTYTVRLRADTIDLTEDGNPVRKGMFTNTDPSKNTTVIEITGLGKNERDSFDIAEYLSDNGYTVVSEDEKYSFAGSWSASFFADDGTYVYGAQYTANDTTVKLTLDFCNSDLTYNYGGSDIIYTEKIVNDLFISGDGVSVNYTYPLTENLNNTVFYPSIVDTYGNLSSESKYYAYEDSKYYYNHIGWKLEGDGYAQYNTNGIYTGTIAVEGGRAYLSVNGEMIDITPTGVSSELTLTAVYEKIPKLVYVLFSTGTKDSTGFDATFDSGERQSFLVCGENGITAEALEALAARVRINTSVETDTDLFDYTIIGWRNNAVSSETVTEIPLDKCKSELGATVKNEDGNDISVVYYPVFIKTPKTVEVTFKAGDDAIFLSNGTDTVTYTVEVERYYSPNGRGYIEIPVKQSSEYYDYVFTGWSQNGDEYEATYTQVRNRTPAPDVGITISDGVNTEDIGSGQIGGYVYQPDTKLLTITKSGMTLSGAGECNVVLSCPEQSPEVIFKDLTLTAPEDITFALQMQYDAILKVAGDVTINTADSTGIALFAPILNIQKSGDTASALSVNITMIDDENTDAAAFVTQSITIDGVSVDVSMKNIAGEYVGALNYAMDGLSVEYNNGGTLVYNGSAIPAQAAAEE